MPIRAVHDAKSAYHHSRPGIEISLRLADMDGRRRTTFRQYI
jgi:hypothetical protein